MKLLSKLTLGTALLLTVGTTTLTASSNTYTVQSGDTLSGIVKKLGFSSLKESGIKKVQSGDINLIFPGEVLEYYKKKKKKSRFVLKNKIDLKKFCFKDNNSIHYRASERCTGKESKKKLGRLKNKK